MRGSVLKQIRHSREAIGNAEKVLDYLEEDGLKYEKKNFFFNLMQKALKSLPLWFQNINNKRN